MVPTKSKAPKKTHVLLYILQIVLAKASHMFGLQPATRSSSRDSNKVQLNFFVTILAHEPIPRGEPK